MSAPVIGITTWQRRIDTDLGRDRPVHSLGVEYAAPIAAAGGIPVLLVPSSGVDEILHRIDGLMISGGEDVEPGRYDAVAQDSKTYDPARDEFEIALIRGARERALPVLAICRGLQIANVAFGGTLVVDIPETDAHRAIVAADEQVSARHTVTFAPDSRLAALYGSARRAVNTIHHQAPDAVAPGFRAVAWAPDGVIEAIEHVDSESGTSQESWPFWAVQWHPEKMLASHEMEEERSLFSAFVDSAQARRADPTTSSKGHHP